MTKLYPIFLVSNLVKKFWHCLLNDTLGVQIFNF